MNRFLLVLFTFTLSLGYGQKYADKDYYLVDKLPYDELSETSKTFVDHYIGYYHQYTDELYKISTVNEIVRQCWDVKVWPLYNKWVQEKTNEILQRENLSDSLRRIYNQFNIGTVYYEGWGYYEKADYTNAIASFATCRDRYEAIGDIQGAANSIDNIGSVYSTIGEYAIALEYHVEGLKLREQINDTLGLGASYNAIGIIHMSHGDYFRAIEDFEKAAEFHVQVGFWSGVSNEYSNIGKILTDLEDYEQALEFHLESFEIKKNLEDKQGMSITLSAVAQICLITGDTTLAIEYTNAAMHLAEEIGDQRVIAANMSFLGFIHFLQGDYKNGTQHCKKALKIAQEIGGRKETQGIMTHLFLGYLWQEKYDEAEPYMFELLDMRREDIKVNFAVLSEQQKGLYFKTMEEEFQNLYAYGNIRKASKPEITTTLYNNTLLLKGLLLQSTTAMRQAILNSNDPYLISKYEEWMMLKTEIADAYAKGLPTKNLEKVANEIEQELVKKSAAFDQYQTQRNHQWTDIKAQLKDGEAAIEFIRFPLNLGDPNSPLVYSALILKSDSEYPLLVDLCKEEDLQQLLGQIRSTNMTYVTDIYGTAEQQDQTLSNLIWEPIKSSLIDIEKIYFSADGLLHKIAFSAIRIDENNFLSDRFELMQVGSTAALLSEQTFEFSSNHTATLFGGVKYSTDTSEHVIWNYLLGTLEEIDSIKNILSDQTNINYFAGYEASEKNFKEVASKSNILHIASHGFFYPDPTLVRKEVKVEMEEENPEFRGGASNYGIWNFVNNENPLMRSGLALAGANDAWQRDVFAKGEDGVLAAQEVANLDMSQTELVVLSACETGLGDIKGTEGVYGLQRAFKMAGVRYLIMSLWQVPDEETAEFMMLFYKNLAKLKDIRQAFNEAQRLMRQKYDPYYWAAFILVE